MLKREDDVLRVINAEAKKKKRRLSEDVASFNLPAGPLQAMKPTRDMITEQWMRVIVKKGLAIDLVDDPEFRAAVVMTARAGTSFMDASNPKGDSFLPHRMHMMNKVLPALEAKLDAKVSKKISGLLKETGAMIISDGWTSVQNKPIINALLSTPAGSQFVRAMDASGVTKDARFVADFVIDIIEAQGASNIVAVCMDGACKASFEMIIDRFDHLFCFICPTHSVDNFLKNVCCDDPTIKVRDIEGEFQWGSDIFSKPIADA